MKLNPNKSRLTHQKHGQMFFGKLHSKKTDHTLTELPKLIKPMEHSLQNHPGCHKHVLTIERKIGIGWQ